MPIAQLNARPLPADLLRPLASPNLTSVPRLLLTSREAAAALSISERTLWSLSAPRGPIPVVRPQGRRAVRYSVASLQAYISQAEANSSGCTNFAPDGETQNGGAN
jgi:hypothetical protein